MTLRMGAIADAIADVIEKRNLFSVIQGRKYVQVEGWAMVGAMVGVFPRTLRTAVHETGHLDVLTVTKWNQRERREVQKTYPAHDGVIAYIAHVELVTRDGGVVGGAEAMCSRREEQWRDRDDNQIASMAQTRAVAKAFRMTFGFVMPMSGYAPTPAEEMGEVVDATFREQAEPGQDHRQPRTAQPPRERSPRVESAPTSEPSAEGIDNVGKLLTYAINLRKFHGLPVERGAAEAALGVDTVPEIAPKYAGNWDEAVQKIRDAFVPQSEHVQQDAPPEPPPLFPAGLDERVGALDDEQRGVYEGFIADGVAPADALTAMGLVG